MGGDGESYALGTIQPFPVPLEQEYSVYSTVVLCSLLGVVLVSVWALGEGPAWAQTTACPEQREICSSKAMFFLSFECIFLRSHVLA